MIKNGFSIEAIVLGRNDDYEPNWSDKLIASIAYNRARFEGSHVDYSVCFVEWNPPRDRPLLAPELVRRFPFLRGIVVDADVHDVLCTSPGLKMMLNFALNCGLHTSRADYCLVSAGDLFIGSTIAGFIRGVGLARNCLYRAERVNIRPDVDFATATPAVLEDPANVLSINTCTEPPYDQPPYTHACGDFLLADRLAMQGLRGFDEGIRSARLHLDSRFCHTAMDAGLNCNLIGQILHINHTKSYVVLGDSYPDVKYEWDAELPYLNPRDWGLADHLWIERGERYWQVSKPGGVHAAPGFAEACAPTIPLQFTAAEVNAINAVTRRIIARKALAPASLPGPDAQSLVSVRLEGLVAHEYWVGAHVTYGKPTIIHTTPAPWAYSAYLELSPLRRQHRRDGRYFWEIEAEVQQGQVGLGLIAGERIVHETMLGPGDGVKRVAVPAEPVDGNLMVRNGAAATSSRIAIYNIRLLHQPGLNQAQLEAEYLMIAS